MNVAERLIDLAVGIADGAAIDWNAADSSASDAERAVIEQLKFVERIACVHAGLPSIATFAGSLVDAVDAPPRTWGPLAIVRKIGSGTYSDVYLARDPKLDRHVALKLLRHRDADAAGDSEVIDEARLLARVRHPNVVTIYGAERIDGRVGIWMEYVDGRTLEAELRARGPFRPDEIARIGAALCDALSAVHGAGVVHRDVKAQNVLRAPDGRVLLTDFGTGHDESGPADAGELAGSPLYLAPEVFEGGSSTVQSDVYSLGVLLFHLTTGSFPVSGRSLDDIREVHRRGSAATLRQAGAHVPRSLAVVVARALSPSAAERFADVAQMAAQLRAAMTPRRRPLLVAAGVAPLAAAAAALLWTEVPRPWSTRGVRSGPTQVRGRSIQQIDVGSLRLIGPPSPDGALLLASNPSDESRLYILDAGGNAPPRYVNDAVHAKPVAEVTSAVFAADSRRVAYALLRAAEGATELRVADVAHVAAGDSQRRGRATRRVGSRFQSVAGDEDYPRGGGSRMGGRRWRHAEPCRRARGRSESRGSLAGRS